MIVWRRASPVLHPSIHPHVCVYASPSPHLGDAEVDDILDVADGERGLGDVGGQNHLALVRRRLKDLVLLESGGLVVKGGW